MLGIATIEECVSNGVRVLALVNPGSARISRVPRNELIKVRECANSDLQEFNISDDDKGTYDVLFHFAWGSTSHEGRQSVNAQVQNIKYTLDAVELAKRVGCRKFVGAGSQAEYGRRNELKIGPDTLTSPETPYGIAKYSAGRLSAIECRNNGIVFNWVRIFSVYGKYDGDKTLLSTLIRNLKGEKRTSLTPAGQRWDYLYSKDAGRAFYLVGEKGKDGKTYCLGSGTATPLKDYVYEVAEIMNVSKDLVGVGDIPYPDGCVMNLCADISGLTKDTGWEPEISFREAIAEMVSEGGR